ncbi:MAG: hypothetical protein DRO09_04215 [Thermoprotei archaeon]|nr:MAG: hypothetical protein DRO09_04215 [Thermoprotei archaeon]
MSRSDRDKLQDTRLALQQLLQRIRKEIDWAFDKMAFVNRVAKDRDEAKYESAWYEGYIQGMDWVLYHLRMIIKNYL